MQDPIQDPKQDPQKPNRLSGIDPGVIKRVQSTRFLNSFDQEGGLDESRPHFDPTAEAVRWFGEHEERRQQQKSYFDFVNYDPSAGEFSLELGKRALRGLGTGMVVTLDTVLAGAEWLFGSYSRPGAGLEGNGPPTHDMEDLVPSPSRNARWDAKREKWVFEDESVDEAQELNAGFITDIRNWWKNPDGEKGDVDALSALNALQSIFTGEKYSQDVLDLVKREQSKVLGDAEIGAAIAGELASFAFGPSKAIGNIASKATIRAMSPAMNRMLRKAIKDGAITAERASEIVRSGQTMRWLAEHHGWGKTWLGRLGVSTAGVVESIPATSMALGAQVGAATPGSAEQKMESAIHGLIGGPAVAGIGAFSRWIGGKIARGTAGTWYRTDAAKAIEMQTSLPAARIRELAKAGDPAARLALDATFAQLIGRAPPRVVRAISESLIESAGFTALGIFENPELLNDLAKANAGDGKAYGQFLSQWLGMAGGLLPMKFGVPHYDIPFFRRTHPELNRAEVYREAKAQLMLRAAQDRLQLVAEKDGLKTKEGEQVVSKEEGEPDAPLSKDDSKAMDDVAKEAFKPEESGASRIEQWEAANELINPLLGAGALMNMPEHGRRTRIPGDVDSELYVPGGKIEIVHAEEGAFDVRVPGEVMRRSVPVKVRKEFPYSKGKDGDVYTMRGDDPLAQEALQYIARDTQLGVVRTMDVVDGHPDFIRAGDGITGSYKLSPEALAKGGMDDISHLYFRMDVTGDVFYFNPKEGTKGWQKAAELTRTEDGHTYSSEDPDFVMFTKVLHEARESGPRERVPPQWIDLVRKLRLMPGGRDNAPAMELISAVIELASTKINGAQYTGPEVGETVKMLDYLSNANAGDALNAVIDTPELALRLANVMGAVAAGQSNALHAIERISELGLVKEGAVAKPEAPKPEAPKAEEAKPEEVKPEEAKPEEAPKEEVTDAEAEKLQAEHKARVAEDLKSHPVYKEYERIIRDADNGKISIEQAQAEMSDLSLKPGFEQIDRFVRENEELVGFDSIEAEEFKSPYESERPVRLRPDVDPKRGEGSKRIPFPKKLHERIQKEAEQDEKGSWIQRRRDAESLYLQLLEVRERELNKDVRPEEAGTRMLELMKRFPALSEGVKAEILSMAEKKYNAARRGVDTDSKELGRQAWRVDDYQREYEGRRAQTSKARGQKLPPLEEKKLERIENALRGEEVRSPTAREAKWTNSLLAVVRQVLSGKITVPDGANRLNKMRSDPRYPAWRQHMLSLGAPQSLLRAPRRLVGEAARIQDKLDRIRTDTSIPARARFEEARKVLFKKKYLDEQREKQDEVDKDARKAGGGKIVGSDIELDPVGPKKSKESLEGLRGEEGGDPFSQRLGQRIVKLPDEAVNPGVKEWAEQVTRGSEGAEHEGTKNLKGYRDMRAEDAEKREAEKKAKAAERKAEVAARKKIAEQKKADRAKAKAKAAEDMTREERADAEEAKLEREAKEEELMAEEEALARFDAAFGDGPKVEEKPEPAPKQEAPAPERQKKQLPQEEKVDPLTEAKSAIEWARDQYESGFLEYAEMVESLNLILSMDKDLLKKLDIDRDKLFSEERAGKENLPGEAGVIRLGRSALTEGKKTPRGLTKADKFVLASANDGLIKKTLAFLSWTNKAWMNRVQQLENTKNPEVAPAARDLARRMRVFDTAYRTMMGNLEADFHRFNQLASKPSVHDWLTNNFVTVGGGLGKLSYFDAMSQQRFIDTVPESVVSQAPKHVQEVLDLYHKLRVETGLDAEASGVLQKKRNWEPRIDKATGKPKVDAAGNTILFKRNSWSRFKPNQDIRVRTRHDLVDTFLEVLRSPESQDAKDLFQAIADYQTAITGKSMTVRRLLQLFGFKTDVDGNIVSQSGKGAKSELSYEERLSAVEQVRALELPTYIKMPNGKFFQIMSGDPIKAGRFMVFSQTQRNAIVRAFGQGDAPKDVRARFGQDGEGLNFHFEEYASKTGSDRGLSEKLKLDVEGRDNPYSLNRLSGPGQKKILRNIKEFIATGRTAQISAAWLYNVSEWFGINPSHMGWRFLGVSMGKHIADVGRKIPALKHIFPKAEEGEIMKSAMQEMREMGAILRDITTLPPDDPLASKILSKIRTTLALPLQKSQRIGEYLAAYGYKRMFEALRAGEYKNPKSVPSQFMDMRLRMLGFTQSERAELLGGKDGPLGDKWGGDRVKEFVQRATVETIGARRQTEKSSVSANEAWQFIEPYNNYFLNRWGQVVKHHLALFDAFRAEAIGHADATPKSVRKRRLASAVSNLGLFYAQGALAGTVSRFLGLYFQNLLRGDADPSKAWEDLMREADAKGLFNFAFESFAEYSAFGGFGATMWGVFTDPTRSVPDKIMRTTAATNYVGQLAHLTSGTGPYSNVPVLSGEWFYRVLNTNAPIVRQVRGLGAAAGLFDTDKYAADRFRLYEWRRSEGKPFRGGAGVAPDDVPYRQGLAQLRSYVEKNFDSLGDRNALIKDPEVKRLMREMLGINTGEAISESLRGLRASGLTGMSLEDKQSFRKFAGDEVLREMYTTEAMLGILADEFDREAGTLPAEDVSFNEIAREAAVQASLGDDSAMQKAYQRLEREAKFAVDTGGDIPTMMVAELASAMASHDSAMRSAGAVFGHSEDWLKAVAAAQKDPAIGGIIFEAALLRRFASLYGAEFNSARKDAIKELGLEMLEEK